ncbi:MAG: V-type ATP synthase subunit D [Candidatus Coatesbacteria bacterium]|nr:V-type ATP synthase subunit D [Candidatus Coatesbacteria bacterium]
MSKIKFTQTELKKQKDLLRRYNKFLPTLKLKKQQLQATIRELEEKIDGERVLLDKLKKEILIWAGILIVEKTALIPVKQFIEVEKLDIHNENIAGIDIPVLDRIIWKTNTFPLLLVKPYTIPASEQLKDYLTRKINVSILKKQEELLNRELRKTTQRVNLFEKVRIPECQENIRVIKIYLGDMEVAAVCRAKIAKLKISMME